MAQKLNPALSETPAQWAKNTGKTARYTSTNINSGRVTSEKQLNAAVNSEKTVKLSPLKNIPNKPMSSKLSASKKTMNKAVPSGKSPRYGSNIKIRKSLLG